MAQCSIHQGFYPVHSKLKELNKGMHELQRMYAELQAAAGAQVAQVRILKQEMEKGELPV